jgi:hypothetical protein
VTSEAEGDEGDGRHGPSTLPAASPGELDAQARAILGAAWRPDPGGGGFCVPNPTTYPWQWLWDSCFHAVVWCHLGDERAVEELGCVLRDQAPDGFVPHVRYVGEHRPHAEFWGRSATSSITQPPMYGHALARLAAAGMSVPDELVERADLGLRFLLDQRRRSAGGLVELCHPWESGCDDSPRWDSTLPGPWTAHGWFAAKGSLLASIERNGHGSPVANPGFAVGSASFTALVAWNALELAGLTGDRALAAEVDELADRLDERWDEERATWVDDGPTAAGSGRTRTIDALVTALVRPRPEVWTALLDPAAFGAPFGPRGVHRGEPTFDPSAYWRGSTWPQLTYLLWVAATRAGEGAVAGSLARSMIGGALTSGFAEHWDPESGAALGAVPQSWTTLTCAMVAA